MGPLCWTGVRCSSNSYYPTIRSPMPFAGEISGLETNRKRPQKSERFSRVAWRLRWRSKRSRGENGRKRKPKLTSSFCEVHRTGHLSRHREGLREEEIDRIRLNIPEIAEIIGEIPARPGVIGERKYRDTVLPDDHSEQSISALRRSFCSIMRSLENPLDTRGKHKFHHVPGVSQAA